MAYIISSGVTSDGITLDNADTLNVLDGGRVNNTTVNSGCSLFISSGGTSILIDAGISCLQIRKRLKSIGHSLGEVSAVFITHDHLDHCVGLPTLCRCNPN